MSKKLATYWTLGTLVKDDGRSVYSDSWQPVLKAADVGAVLKETRWAAEFIVKRYNYVKDDENWATTDALANKQRAQRLLAELEEP